MMKTFGVMPWQCLCPNCSETVWIDTDTSKLPWIITCQKCKTVWTMSELEIFELSFISELDPDLDKLVQKLVDDTFREAFEDIR